MSACDHSQPWLVTFLPGGHRIDAHPGLDADMVDQAHDLIHLMLAKALDLPTSPALLRALGKWDVISDDLLAYEEAAVLAIQDLLRAYRESAGTPR